MEVLSSMPPESAALAATLIISVAPTIVLFTFPQGTTTGKDQGHGHAKSTFDRTMLAFAAGGLLGDVFLHSMPHLLMGHSHQQHHHNHEDHVQGLADAHDHAKHHDHDHHDHDHHDHDHHDQEHADHHDHAAMHDRATVVGLCVLGGFIAFYVFEKIIRSVQAYRAEQIRKKSDDEQRGFTLKAAGFLNLAADSLHNFTDGVAIAASFVSGAQGLGLATSLSVLVHELPHEIADYSILRQNGCSKLQAIGLQFCTAVFAFLGTVAGLTSQSFEAHSDLILALVSGGFVYIATMSVMAELMQHHCSITQSFIEVIAFGVGVALMVVVAALE